MGISERDPNYRQAHLARDPSESVAGEVEKCGGNLVAHLSVEAALGRHVCVVHVRAGFLVRESCCVEAEPEACEQVSW
jgi:hypothetical protein